MTNNHHRTPKYQKTAYLRHFASAPFIFAPFIPALIFDLFIEIYHHICFPLYGLEKIKRSHYIQVWDRTQLNHLTWYEKIYCAYCGYMNGALIYWSAIAKETESYWCNIIHKNKPGWNQEAYQYQREKGFKEFN